MKSLRRGLDVWRVLSRQGVMSAAELSGRVGIAESSLYRYLVVLEDEGMVERRKGAFVAIGSLHGRYADTTGLGSLVHGILRSLGGDSKETCMLTTRQDAEAFVLEVVEAEGPLKVSFTAGTRRPLVHGASAKVLLVATDEEELHTTARAAGLRDERVEDLWKDVVRLRETGFIVTSSEVDQGITGIAVPVRRSSGEVYGLSIVAPSYRATGPVLDKHLRLLKRSAMLLASHPAW